MIRQRRKVILVVCGLLSAFAVIAWLFLPEPSQEFAHFKELNSIADLEKKLANFNGLLWIHHDWSTSSLLFLYQIEKDKKWMARHSGLAFTFYTIDSAPGDSARTESQLRRIFLDRGVTNQDFDAGIDGTLVLHFGDRISLLPISKHKFDVETIQQIVDMAVQNHREEP